MPFRYPRSSPISCGAKPIPNLSATSRVILRPARYSRAPRPRSCSQSIFENQADAVAIVSQSGSRGSGPSRARCTSRTSTPDFSPTYFTASTNERPSRFCTKVKTDPFSWQTKQ